ncbi:hypothetical protein ES708_25182 [subsurface metagenome]
MEKRNFQGYTEAFKRHVVQEVESGRITQCEAGRRYGILGHSTILKWFRRYGKTAKRSDPTIMVKQDFEKLCQANEIKALKAELKEAKFKNLVLETLIEVAEEELHVPIRKKFGAKRSAK